MNEQEGGGLDSGLNALKLSPKKEKKKNKKLQKLMQKQQAQQDQSGFDGQDFVQGVTPDQTAAHSQSQFSSPKKVKIVNDD